MMIIGRESLSRVLNDEGSSKVVKEDVKSLRKFQDKLSASLVFHSFLAYFEVIEIFASALSSFHPTSSQL